MNYWLDLFTGTTWRQFLEAGGTVSGFRQKQRKLAARLQPGDILLCYLTAVLRRIAALEVLKPTNDTRPTRTDDFPVRFEVKPLVTLQPEYGVPMPDLEGRVDFHRGLEDRGPNRGMQTSYSKPRRQW